MVRNPAEERRWLRVSGKESPIQARLVWPERLSKGRTRTTRPLVSADSGSGVDWGRAGRAKRRRRSAGHGFSSRRSGEGLVTGMSIERQGWSGGDRRQRASKLPSYHF